MTDEKPVITEEMLRAAAELGAETALSLQELKRGQRIEEPTRTEVVKAVANINLARAGVETDKPSGQTQLKSNFNGFSPQLRQERVHHPAGPLSIFTPGL